MTHATSVGHNTGMAWHVWEQRNPATSVLCPTLKACGTAVAFMPLQLLIVSHCNITSMISSKVFTAVCVLDGLLMAFTYTVLADSSCISATAS